MMARKNRSDTDTTYHEEVRTAPEAGEKTGAASLMNDAEVEAATEPSEEVRAEPEPTLGRVLEIRHPPMIGEDVQAVQAALIARGCQCGKSGKDGKYGPDTALAVRFTQAFTPGCLITGKVDKRTAAALGIAWTPAKSE
jgi:peptidoglycan hydrolase-like protein with peptidoglycan-binding domain